MPDTENIKSKEEWFETVENKVSNTSKDEKIKENNILYAKWWIGNLSEKIVSVLSVAKNISSTPYQKKYWAKYAVRVKLYNSLNNIMEEHSLLDIVLYVLKHNEKFPELSVDSKHQCNILGSYYISNDVYLHIKKIYGECVENNQ